MAGEARTSAAMEVRRRQGNEKLTRVKKALASLPDGEAVSVAAVARAAGVSRSFLYQNDEAQRLVSGHERRGIRRRPAPMGQDAAWKQRALNAESHISQLVDEINLQRARIGELIGQVRDLQSDLPADGVQRLSEENRALRQENAQLVRDNRRANERLAASRDNNRFLDKRVADFEAEILEVRGFDQTSPGGGRRGDADHR